jgi:hypothetical protein
VFTTLLTFEGNSGSYETLQDKNLLSLLQPDLQSQPQLERAQQQQQQLEDLYEFPQDSLSTSTVWFGGDDVGQSWIWDDLFQFA